jgi:hypothetical protein
VTPGRAFAPMRRRSGGTTTALLRDIWASLDRPVQEAYIPDPQRLVYGHYEEQNDLVVINGPLLRVSIFLHESIHRARPKWSERVVRRRCTQILKRMSDAEILDLDARIVAALDQSPRRRSRAA